VAVPQWGAPSEQRRADEKQPAFRRAARFRAAMRGGSACSSNTPATATTVRSPAHARELALRPDDASWNNGRRRFAWPEVRMAVSRSRVFRCTRSCGGIRASAGMNIHSINTVGRVRAETTAASSNRHPRRGRRGCHSERIRCWCCGELDGEPRAGVPRIWVDKCRMGLSHWPAGPISESLPFPAETFTNIAVCQERVWSVPHSCPPCRERQAARSTHSNS
jgi:hypothetical protein